MHLLLWAEDSAAELRAELALAAAELGGDRAAGAGVLREPGQQLRISHSILQSQRPAFIEADFGIEAGKPLPQLVFARQLLPHAQPVRAESIRAWAGTLFETIAVALPEQQPWSMHLEPHYHVPAAHRIGARAWHSAKRGWRAEGRGAGSESEPPDPRRPEGEAGRHRCRLISEALVELLQRKRRHLLRRLRRETAPFTAQHSLVQLLLTSPEAGFLSVARAPLPFEQRHLISPFPKGEVPVASDKSAPSRAFAKLVEAEQRLGRGIQAGETCVDLGAAPGSWTYVAVNRGAQVVAVDRSSLREDLMASRLVKFEPGDAFRYQPSRPVDWLLCDVIAAPERTAALLLEWLRRGWCRQFVVTVKLGDQARPTPNFGSEALAELKAGLPALTGEFWITRLCANKKEVCVFGTTNKLTGHASI
jgi:23S rRNA (cytidine2498-2'-O)-methyltransferase